VIALTRRVIALTARESVVTRRAGVVNRPGHGRAPPGSQALAMKALDASVRRPLRARGVAITR